MNQLLSDWPILPCEGRSNTVISHSCLFRCTARLRSRITYLSGLYKWPNMCHLKPFSSLCWWPRYLDVGWSKSASRRYHQCKQLVDLAKPSQKCSHLSLGVTTANRFIIHDGAMASDIPTPYLEKGVGVWTASRSFFNHHHSLAGKVGFSALNIIKVTFPRINRDDFKQLHVIYCWLILEYASSVIHSRLQTDPMCLEKVQWTAMPLVRGIQTYPYNVRLLLLNFHPLDIHRLRGDSNSIFRLFAGKQAGYCFTLAGESSYIVRAPPEWTLDHWCDDITKVVMTLTR